ncbi:MAG: ATP-binding protein [Fibrobacterota bacterium]
MCDFCTQHNDGKKWFLNAENYSQELLHDPARKEIIQNFYHKQIGEGNKNISKLEKIAEQKPALIKRVAPAFTEKQQKEHWGQVVTLEEVEEIIERTNSIVRFACGCMWEKEKKEGRYCFGISFNPSAWYNELDMEWFDAPHIAHMEDMTKKEAMACIRQYDRKGMVHSVWTFGTPFIGAVCNCDMQYCLAMRASYKVGMSAMFRGLKTAGINSDLCSSCGACKEVCQLNAISENSDSYRVSSSKCIGCGTCRSVCENNAISL